MDFSLEEQIWTHEWKINNVWLYFNYNNNLIFFRIEKKYNFFLNKWVNLFNP